MNLLRDYMMGLRAEGELPVDEPEEADQPEEGPDYLDDDYDEEVD